MLQAFFIFYVGLSIIEISSRLVLNGAPNFQLQLEIEHSGINESVCMKKRLCLLKTASIFLWWDMNLDIIF